MAKDLTNKVKERKIGGFRKWFLVGAAIVKLGTMTGCSLPGPNQAPETKIERQYKDDGTVEYTLSGTDSDGSVDYISANINGGGYQNFPNNSTVSVPIIEYNNTIEAIAYDNEGLGDATPEIKDFYSPTEDEATNIIRNTLDPFTYEYIVNHVVYEGFERNMLVGLWADDDAVIDYMGQDKDLMDAKGISNICPQRTSTSEIERKVREFQDNGYKE